MSPADPSAGGRPDVDASDDTVIRSRPDPARDVDDTVLTRRSALDDTVVPAARAGQAAGRTRSEPASRPAPRLHAVRVAGRTVPLDVPLVVGRRPTTPRVSAGPAPRLVAVPSPSGEVSGSHIDVRQQGDTVVVTDLRSTNGTRIAQPGRVPVVLRQGESLVTLAGTIVDVGDGNLLEILPPQRLTLKEERHP